MYQLNRNLFSKISNRSNGNVLTERKSRRLKILHQLVRWRTGRFEPTQISIADINQLYIYHQHRYLVQHFVA